MIRGKRINWRGLAKYLKDIFIDGLPYQSLYQQGGKTFEKTKRREPITKIQQEQFLKLLMKKYNCSHKAAWMKTQEIVERLPEYTFIIEKPEIVTIENSNRVKPKKMLILTKS